MPEIPNGTGKSARPIIIAANRTCVNIKPLGDGKYEYGIASGGLVTALNALKDSTKLLWYGNPGKAVPSDDLEKVEEEIRGKGAVPVWIDPHLMDLYYNKFSSKFFSSTSSRAQALIVFRWCSLAYSSLPY